MKKKFLLLLALGLATSVQAQNAPATAPANAANAANATAVPVAEPAPAAPAAQPAPAPAPANAASAAAVPVAEPAPAAPAAQPAAEPIAVAEPAPAADSVATAEPEQAAAPADSAAAPEQVAVADTAKADSATAPEQAAAPADSAAAPEQVAVADSAKAATDSLANDTSKVAKAPVNKLGDILHGNAYNTVWNEAAAATIGGNIGYPHFMYGSKLAYFDPVAQQGAVAFGDSWTYFLSFDNNANMGLLTAGIAFQKFGASLDYSMGKHWRYTDHADKSEETEKSTDAGSMVGANVSANFGSFDVLFSGHYMTPYGDYFLSLPDSETEENAWAASGYVGLSYSGDVYYWTLGVEGMRNEYKHKTSNSEIKMIDGKNYRVTTTNTLTDTLAHIMITPSFSIGAAVLSSEKANVYLGLNTSVPMYSFDEIDSVCDKHNEALIIMTPNILGEVQLSKYFMAFGGASYDWVAAAYSDRELNKEKTETIATTVGATTVNLGARFEYGPTAVELAFTERFLENPFSGYADKSAIVTSLGAFIYF
ncbi:MAG: hypothetical protein IJ909_06735 [Fibrobacter sp.]|nr:hypothetical protein [Fibrobacter sp.]